MVNSGLLEARHSEFRSRVAESSPRGPVSGASVRAAFSEPPRVHHGADRPARPSTPDPVVENSGSDCQHPLENVGVTLVLSVPSLEVAFHAVADSALFVRRSHVWISVLAGRRGLGRRVAIGLIAGIGHAVVGGRQQPKVRA